MDLLLQTSPPFVNAKVLGTDSYTRGEGDKSHFCPGEDPLYAHA
jgi:hypothetical protein